MRSSLYLILTIVAFGLLASCGSPQDEWTFPSLPDYSSSVNDGETYTFRWTSKLQTHFTKWCPGCDPENVDVWLTGGSGSTFTKHKVSSSIDVINSRSFVWTVGTSGPSGIEYWVLRFTTPGGYLDGQQEVSSPIFKIKRSSSKSTSISENSFPTATRFVTVGTPIFVPVTSSSISEASQSNTAISTASGTESAPSDPSNTSTNEAVGDIKSKLTTGSIVGIAAAVVIAVLLIALAVLGYCCYKQRRNRPRDAAGQHNHQLEPVPRVQNPQPTHSAAGHSTLIRARLSSPHAANHIFANNVSLSCASNEELGRDYDRLSTGHEIARANDSNTSLLSAPIRVPPDKLLLREPAISHAITSYTTKDTRVAKSEDNTFRGAVASKTEHAARKNQTSAERTDTRSESNEALVGGMSEIENPNPRLSVNIREYLAERRCYEP